MIPEQHPQQFARVQPVGLRTALASVHLDARRVDHPVVDPNCREVPMQPKTVAPRFVTTPHSGVRWECEPLLCCCDLSGKPHQVSCWHYSHARLGSKIFGETNLPLLNSQFKREIQYLRCLGRRSGILAIASRCGHLYAPFSSSARLGLKELTSSDSFCPL